MKPDMKSEVRIARPSDSDSVDGISLERLRSILQDSNINFLIGAGTSVPFFAQLGDIEAALTKLVEPDDASRLARISLQAYFFENVLLPNLRLLEARNDEGARNLIKSYAQLLATINQILISRRSTLLGKQVNLFTTNVDMAIELALELLEIDSNDGFTGKIQPRLDLGEYGTLRFRQGQQYGYRSEVPTMNLLKLHGSAGWMGRKEEIYFDHKLTLIREVQDSFARVKESLIPITDPLEVDPDTLRYEAELYELTPEIVAFSQAYDKLQIINPEKTKFASTVLNKTYYELIRRFANELEKENCVLLVHGFSFRDEHLLDLVLRSAATNPTLQVIVICYSRKAFSEIRALFPDERVKNGNVLFVQPNEPKQRDNADGDDSEPPKERKLSLDVVVSDLLAKVLDEVPAKADHIVEIRLGTSGKDSADA